MRPPSTDYMKSSTPKKSTDKADRKLLDLANRALAADRESKAAKAQAHLAKTAFKNAKKALKAARNDFKAAKKAARKAQKHAASAAKTLQVQLKKLKKKPHATSLPTKGGPGAHRASRPGKAALKMAAHANSDGRASRAK
jgi:hypothetical protein